MRRDLGQQPVIITTTGRRSALVNDVTVASRTHLVLPRRRQALVNEPTVHLGNAHGAAATFARVPAHDCGAVRRTTLPNTASD